jgi:carbon storage regulator
VLNLYDCDGCFEHPAEKELLKGNGKDFKMLVLTRSKEQSIMINDDVEITVVEVYGRKVRLGITAPKSVPVHRREVYDAIKASQTGRPVRRIGRVPLHIYSVSGR